MSRPHPLPPPRRSNDPGRSAGGEEEDTKGGRWRSPPSSFEKNLPPPALRRPLETWPVQGEGRVGGVARLRKIFTPSEDRRLAMTKLRRGRHLRPSAQVFFGRWPAPKARGSSSVTVICAAIRPPASTMITSASGPNSERTWRQLPHGGPPFSA